MYRPRSKGKKYSRGQYIPGVELITVDVGERKVHSGVRLHDPQCRSCTLTSPPWVSWEFSPVRVFWGLLERGPTKGSE